MASRIEELNEMRIIADPGARQYKSFALLPIPQKMSNSFITLDLLTLKFVFR